MIHGYPAEFDPAAAAFLLERLRNGKAIAPPSSMLWLPGDLAMLGGSCHRLLTYRFGQPANILEVFAECSALIQEQDGSAGQMLPTLGQGGVA